MSLLRKKITCIGTLKKNKREIPVEFLPQRDRVPGSSLFGYQQDITSVSYVPKKNKAVVLLSTMHDKGTLDEHTNKPDIIIDYNMTKGGVDTVDQMCSKYSVNRITRRWTMLVWYSLLNVAGINAQILFHSNQSNCPVVRRIFLKNLSFQLMKGHLTERAAIPSLPLDIRVFLDKYKVEEQTETEEQPLKKRGRCKTCGRSKNINTTVRCSSCANFVCKNHSQTTITCESCSESRLDIESE